MAKPSRRTKSRAAVHRENDRIMDRRLRRLIAFSLVAMIIITYWPVRNHEFVTYDDLKYVQNSHVQRGLTAEGVGWAFTTGYMSNWHPVTWISHMIDVELFGESARGPHMVNVIVHAIDATLLFFVLVQLTGATWRSAAVAALFALHPLHVESVAWVAERKDLLSTLFALLALRAYASYIRMPHTWRYGVVVVWFAMSLMSKPMYVTLPFVLLLLDIWPLKRIDLAEGFYALLHNSKWRTLLMEKVPLLTLAAVSSVVTYLVQREGGAMQLMAPVPLMQRFGNSLIAYVQYISDMFWPTGLAVLYPHPGQWPAWQVIGATAILATITLIAIKLGRRHSHVLIGWLLYVGTLIPVIGLIQIGEHARADRYTYFPLIGLFIAIAWSIPLPIAARTWHRHAYATGAVILCIALVVATRSQLSHWISSRTLYERAVAVTKNNYTAHNNLANDLGQNGEFDQALHHFEIAIAINDRYAEAFSGIGDVYTNREEHDKAVEAYRNALDNDPSLAAAHVGLASVHYRQGRLDDAITHFEAAFERDAAIKNIQFNLALLYAATGRLEKAENMYALAIRSEPKRADAYDGLARVMLVKNKPTDALLNARRANELTGHVNPSMLMTLAASHAALGQQPQAGQYARAALDRSTQLGDLAMAEQIRTAITQWGLAEPGK